MAKRRKWSGQPHVRLHIWLLDSEAWLSLSTQARSVYVQLARRYRGTNNGRIGLSVRDAGRECRISKNTAARAFHELVEKGFIRQKTAGGFSYKMRHSSEWLLTEHRDDVNQQPGTRDFMRWQKK